MKKIGYVLSTFPVLSETFVGTEMRAMERVGHEVQPIAFSENPTGGQARDRELLEQLHRKQAQAGRQGTDQAARAEPRPARLRVVSAATRTR